MGLLDLFRKKSTSAWDELQNDPAFREHRTLFEAMQKLCQNGVDADELPNGRGEFAYSPTNPVPCHTVLGETSFLAKLRTKDGTKINYARIGSISNDVSEFPIDAYRVSHPDGSELATLYFSPYHKRNSRKVPRDFLLAGIPQ